MLFVATIAQARRPLASRLAKVKGHRSGGYGKEIGPSVSSWRVSHLEDLEKRLLHTFSANVSGDAHVLELARYLAVDRVRGGWTRRVDNRKVDSSAQRVVIFFKMIHELL